jgi:hypothetical protein
LISDDFGERWRAYTGAHVRLDHPELGAIEVQPDTSGRVAGDFPEPGRTIHIMTAHNPGRPLPDAENGQRQRLLASLVQNLPEVCSWPATGGDPTWTHCEESLAIVGLTDPAALDLARQFDQEAIFAWNEDSWRVVACARDVDHSSGWVVRRRGGAV